MEYYAKFQTKQTVAILKFAHPENIQFVSFYQYIHLLSCSYQNSSAKWTPISEQNHFWSELDTSFVDVGSF